MDNITTRDLQKKVMQNKVAHNFNTSDVNKEFLLLYGEVAEAWDAFRKNQGGFAEELADIAIYLLGISEMSGIDLGKEIISKMKINEKRVYLNADGTVNEKFDPEYLPHMSDYFMDGMK